MAKVACRKRECCDPNSVTLTPNAYAKITKPTRNCTEILEFACEGINVVFNAKNGEKTVKSGEDGATRSILKLGCKDGKYQGNNNESVTSIVCNGDQPTTTTTRDPKIPPDCCQFADVTYTNETEGVLHRLLKETCNREFYYNCSASPTHYPIMVISTTGAEENLPGTATKVLPVKFGCANKTITYNGKTLKALKCSSRLAETTTTTTTTTFPCCKMADLTTTVEGGAQVQRPTETVYCKPDLKINCSHATSTNEVCAELAPTIPGVNKACNLGRIETDLKCISGKIKSAVGDHDISSITCKAAPVQTPSTSTTTKSCCKFNTQIPAASATGIKAITDAACPNVDLKIECATATDTLTLKDVDGTDIDFNVKDITVQCVKSKYEHTDTEIASVTCAAPVGG